MSKREYKDTVFVDLFFHCEVALENFASLLRALCDFLSIDFQFGVEDLQPMSLESALYNGCRTDVLYNVKDRFLVFIEHQSTVNPNMPARFLEYVVEVLKKLPYGRKKYGRVPLFFRDFIFLNLYNGKEEVEDVYNSYLSDLIGSPVLKDSTLELKMTNININVGHNEKLLKSCPVLEGYSLFVEEVRQQLKVDQENGFDIAVDNCIQKGILEEYLSENRRGVMGLFFGDYNMETALEVAREESYDRGIAKGIERGSYDNQIETAKRCLSIGLPMNTIIEVTGLTNSEIVKLKARS